jgi:bis(5'-nucleosyl)-tetraphosphatase (symmetrical)
MATYCIGDIQGCFAELQDLLALINFDRERDCLWFTGDLVNRGPHSLEVLRFVKNLPHKVVVLGNHDFHLLSLYHRTKNQQTSLTHHSHSLLLPVLTAPDCDELLTWLQQQPLLHHDEQLGYVVTHAGIYPHWDLAKAKILAAEVAKALQNAAVYPELFLHMYGDYPDLWNDELSGLDRLRFIINAFTRMRFCTLKEAKLEFMHTGKIGTQPPGYVPWFNVPWRKTCDVKIIFGHWAALEGKVTEPNVYALDTGCVWGGSLLALRLEDGKRFETKKIITNYE